MKYFFALLTLSITLTLTIALNSKLGPAPPFGKFLNPFQGFWQNAVNETFSKNIEASLSGLKDEVKVSYDERLVPHIVAKNDEDLYFMQGYITAKNRLWQMEISTHAAAGRVSEIVGDAALENDRLMRRIGMGFGAENAEAFIAKDEESRRQIQAYCDGINAYISSLSPAQYPVEYKLLNYAPEQWQTLKVALLLKNMANMLSIYEYDIQNSAFIEKFGLDEFRKLFPDFEQGAEDPIVPVGEKQVGSKQLAVSSDKIKVGSKQLAVGSDKIKVGSKQLAVGSNKIQVGSKQLAVGSNKIKVGSKQLAVGSNKIQVGSEQYAVGRITKAISYEPLAMRKEQPNAIPNHTSKIKNQKSAIRNPFEPNADAAIGSNNWAVSGSKTASGKPILCNDPHLQLSLPSIWYEIHLSSPTVNVYGATLPGAPAVIIGFNDSIAWGVTNGGRDVRDWYKTEFKDNTRTQYKLDNEWQPTTFRIERYKLAGGKEFIDTVVFTKFGPVVYDRTFGDALAKKNLAMKWTAHLPSNEFKTFHLINRGNNYNDYKNALNYFTCPSQNFVFASAAGDIAIQQQGKFPLRDRATEQGKFISTSETKNDWTDYIPYEANPHSHNPARGFVSSANQHPTDENYPYYYPGVGVYENYRNRVINKILGESQSITAADMMKMQDNNYFLLAAEALPAMIALLDEKKLNTEETKVLNTLKAWNHYTNPKELAPVYFEIWWNELRRNLFDEFQDPKLSLKQPTFYAIVRMLKTDSTSIFYDNKNTEAKETRADIIANSFKVIAASIANKEFVEVREPYGTDLPHKLEDVNNLDWGKYKATRVEHLARIAPFTRFNVYNGGNLGIINATNSTHGPSWRMVVDFGERKAHVVYPGGQSGNPGSKYYDNMIDTWAKGEYYTANFFGVKAKTVLVENYKPQKK